MSALIIALSALAVAQDAAPAPAPAPAITAPTQPLPTSGPDSWFPKLVFEGKELQDGFFPLYDGIILDGWTITGENKDAFDVHNGLLKATGSGNGGWLKLNQTYENFVLRFDYRFTDGKGASSIVVRGDADGDLVQTGLQIPLLAEDTEASVTSCGALLGAVKPAVYSRRPAGSWNKMEISCKDSKVSVSLNETELYNVDVATLAEGASLVERAAKGGVIAIQDGACRMDFRFVRILPLAGGEGWKPLFNGKDLSGWTTVGDAQWSAEADGVLKVDNSKITMPSGLRTTEEFGDFELRLKARTNKDGVSGVFLRCSGDAPWPDTYKVQIDSTDKIQFTGAIMQQCKATELRSSDLRWANIHIIAKGAHIQVLVNGKVVTDYESPKHEQCKSGWLLLQGHDPGSVAEFKDIEVKPLTAEAPAAPAPVPAVAPTPAETPAAVAAPAEAQPAAAPAKKGWLKDKEKTH
jgi:hypothetical protein